MGSQVYTYLLRRSSTVRWHRGLLDEVKWWCVLLPMVSEKSIFLLCLETTGHQHLQSLANCFGDGCNGVFAFLSLGVNNMDLHMRKVCRLNTLSWAWLHPCTHKLGPCVHKLRVLDPH